MGKFDIHVIGAGRGGSSLLAAVIDRHPQCSIHLEEHSLTHLLGRSETEGERESPPPVRARRRIERYLEACEAHAARSPEPHWGHKTTTEQIGALATIGAEPDPGAIDLFLERVAAIPAVFITRDGRTCIPSKMRRTGQDLETAISRWRDSIALLTRWRSAPGRLHVVRMEDLVADPTDAIAGICRFLGVAFSAAMLAGPSNSKMRPEYQRDAFDPEVVAVGENPPWTGRIEAELAYCGYL